jgi:hypothetical protein
LFLYEILKCKAALEIFMARGEKKQLDDQVTDDVKETIDIVLSTLYANDERGYFGLGMTPNQVKSEGIKRIKRKLETLDGKTKGALAPAYESRMTRFDSWSALPRSEKEEIARLAKSRQISLEKAYELRLSGDARN